MPDPALLKARPWLRHYEQHGKFNVGILSFRNDTAGRVCLADWRARCLDWCFDRLDDGKYADQKYLDGWPAKVGLALLVLDHPGVNLAPWNWAGHSLRWSALPSTRLSGEHASSQRVEGNALHLSIDGQPLMLFHFARLRPIYGTWWWQSGQLEYGVMPWPLRNAIYGPYVRALLAARAEIAARRLGFDFSRRPAPLGRDFWRNLPLRMVFGGNWLRTGAGFLNLRLGLGRWSGRALAGVRRLRG